MGRTRRRHRAHGQQEVADLTASLETVVKLFKDGQKKEGVRKTNELARRAMHHSATGVNIRDAIKRLIIDLEAHKEIPAKMLYACITQFASSDTEMATMIAGLLAKRCDDADPDVARLSLAFLTSLRIPSLADFMVAPVEKLLSSRQPSSVRATAVLGVLKVATLNEAHNESSLDLSHLWRRVNELLVEDEKTEVIAACLAVTLQRGSVEEIVKDAQLVEDLILRLQEFEPHERALVLAVVKRFTPTEDLTSAFGHPDPVPQVVAFMDAVETCLFATDTGLVLAAVDALLQWARGTNNEIWYSTALDRVKRPLFSLCRHGDPEVVFVALKHVELLVQRAPYAFADDYLHFFCKSSDPPYVKEAKLEVLQRLATFENWGPLVEELMEMSKDRDLGTMRAAIRGISRVILAVDTQGAIENLVSLLMSNDPDVVPEALGVLPDITRKFPYVLDAYAPQLQHLTLAQLHSDEARAAYLWVRAEMDVRGISDDGAEPTPYIAEELLDRWPALSPRCKCEILFSAARVATVRAPMMLPIMQRLLGLALDDASLVVADAANIVASACALSTDALRVLSESPGVVEDDDVPFEELLDREFNTLSVVLGDLERNFVDQSLALALKEVPERPSEDGDDETIEAMEGAEEPFEEPLLDLGDLM